MMAAKKKGKSTVLNVEIGPLMERLRGVARKNERKIKAEVIRAIREHVKREEGQA